MNPALLALSLGIELAAGRHATTLRFRPPGLLAGTALTGTALLLALAMAIRRRPLASRRLTLSCGEV